MMRFALWVAGVSVLAGFAQAEEIHKCTGPDGIIYQNLPCAAGQQEQRLPSSIALNEQRRDAINAGNRSRQVPQELPAQTITSRHDMSTGPQSQRANRYAGTPFAATTLFIGMTDTQVLNLAGWGRPMRISRSKGRDGWSEQWVYRNSSDEMSLLYFRNGRLIEREEAAAPILEARMSND